MSRSILSSDQLTPEVVAYIASYHQKTIGSYREALAVLKGGTIARGG